MSYHGALDAVKIYTTIHAPPNFSKEVDMQPSKIEAGSLFPDMTAQSLDGSTVDLGKPGDDTDWKMVVVYRGRHCPLCTKYLNKMEDYKHG